ncbi:pyrroline-5-carboxylate reductase [Pradoshia sp.]|uniref:pyrroline-5-carboxylate reductase n=1 Tax=Pradoshia sp. TaxID=2651281 RepID=UPI003F0BDC56
MDKKIGFIGCGNMGRAMLGALMKSEQISPDSIMASVRTESSLHELKEKWPIRTTLNNLEVAQQSDIIIMAVNPAQYESVLKEIREVITFDQIIVSIAAGIKLEQMDVWIGKSSKIIKTMPNTPVLVQEGMTAICSNEHVLDTEMELMREYFQLFGEVEVMEEEQFDAFIALCGSSPAYIFMLIEAMADGAVKLGIPRKQAIKMAEQAILGSAKLAMDTGIHPAELKDMVCSPGGSTIAAVSALEERGFRSAVIQAMEVCARQSKKMNDEL